MTVPPAPPIRPRRSFLFMPGSNGRAIAKARTLPADVIVLDLEDAVAPDAKDTARRQVLAELEAGGFGPREVLVRVNGADTPWGAADLDAVARAPVDGVLLPKVDDAASVRRAVDTLDAAGAPAPLRLWCMIETPLGVLDVRAIAGASPRLAGLVVGTADLAKDLHAAHTATRLPMLTALGLCLLAARAHHLAIIDGVHLDIGDMDGLAAACRQGAELGFDGKSLIHPGQIAAANAAFGPDPAAVEAARRTIEAHAAAVAAGSGVAVLDGRLVEALHVAEARRIVALAEAIAERGG